MPAIAVKGEIINAFVAGLSAIGEKRSTVIRLETVGNALVGNFTSSNHASLSDATLILDGIDKDGMENMLVGVDLSDLQLIPKLVGKEDLVSIRFDQEEAKCHLSFGPSRRSFKLLSSTEIPPPFTVKPTLPAKWRLPKEIIKPLVDTLSLEGDPVLTIKKNGDGDTSLRFSTKDYGGLNTAEYLVTGEMLKDYEGPAFRSMFDFGMFSSVKDLPTDSHIVFRCDEDFPIEMIGVKGPVTSRIMLAPRIESE
jgi:hypothetical protein